MCGRRTGKTTLGQVLAAETILDGYPVGWFAPTYRYLTEAMRDLEKWLKPVIRRSDFTEKRFELATGGVIEFWTLDTKDAGRSRKYKRVIIDEAGIVVDLLASWQQAIRPTLTDYTGDAWILGTPRGRREFQQMFEYEVQGKKGWRSFRLATSTNPVIDPQELADAKAELPPAIYAQEYEGVPAPDGGNPFGMDSIAAAYKPELATVKGTVSQWGIDLAKSQDWTVAIGLDADGKQVEMHRWQGIPWSETMDRLVGIVKNAHALVDSTGVGDPIVEQLQRRCPSIQGYQFSQSSKQRIMEGLAVGLQSGGLSFYDPVVKSELEMFEYEYTRTGVHYCMTPNTRILTSDLRWVELGSVSVGDTLLAFDENTVGDSKARRWRKSTVLSVNRVTKPCYELTLSDGTVVTSSNDHLWLVDASGSYRWIKTEDLRARHPTSKSLRFAAHRLTRLLDVWETGKTYEDGYMAAAFDGEGCLSQRPKWGGRGHSFRLGFAQKNNAMADEMRSMAKAGGYRLVECKSKKTVINFSLNEKRHGLLKVLGKIRPKRLLAKMDIEKLGTVVRIGAPHIVSSRFIGDREVVAISTTTRTFVAEGLATHNCAPDGLHDDCVCALALAYHGLTMRPRLVYGSVDRLPASVANKPRVATWDDEHF